MVAALDARSNDLAVDVLGVVLVDVSGTATAVRDLGSGHDEDSLVGVETCSSGVVL